LKKFKVSLIYILFLAVINVFHSYLRTLILNLSAETFVLYLIYGLFFSFFLLIFIKCVRTRRNLEIAIVFLVMGVIFFFLFSNPRLLFKLTILEFFILGLLVALDNRKSKSPLPYLLLFGTAFLIEIVTSLFAAPHFYYLDVWIHSLIGLSGYIAGFLLI